MISLSMDIERVLDCVSRWYSGLSSIDPMTLFCVSAGCDWNSDILCSVRVGESGLLLEPPDVNGHLSMKGG